MPSLPDDDPDRREALPALHIGARLTISWTLVLWSGLIGAVVSSWVLMLLRTLGVTRYLPRAYWGCALFGSTSSAAILFGAFFRMIAMILILPFVYAAIFQYTGRAEAIVGLVIGLAHGLLAGLMLPLAAGRCGANPPGLLGWNLGRATPLALLFVHAVYGSLIGYIYVNG